MIRTGEEYRASIRDGREVWIDGEKVADVPSHPAFKPLVDIRARIYDLAHEPATQDAMTWLDPETGERCAIGPRLPRTAADWRAKRRAVDTVLDEIGGVVTRVGDETVGEMWSLYDGQDVLNEIDPRFSANIRRHVARAAVADPFHVSANTDPKGDRSKRPQDQDPDMLLHVARETDGGIVVRGAKFETAAAYANQAFVKPTIANWGDSELSDYAVGFIAPMGAPGMKHICRSGFAGRAPAEDYPLSSRFDEIDTLIVFDDVFVPWEDVFVYGDLDNYDAVCRFLAERAGVRVVAIDYRLAPEHGFPAAVDDVLAAYRWVVEHTEGLGIDPERVAVGGDSAGGNLAAVVAQQTVGSDAAPVFQLLIYPLTDMAEVWPSRKSFADGFFFSTLFRDVIDTHYTASAPDRWDPRISPLHGGVTGVAPAYLVTAGFDPLLDEGKAYADKLADAGVQVEYVCEEGLIHSFANMVSLGRSGPEAMARAAEALRRGLAR